MEERQHIILFDQYLAGEMDLTEKAAFEERLLHSESLKKSFDAYVAFSKEIEAGGEYGEIKEDLKHIHADLYGRKKTKIVQLRYLIPIGIAASIGLLFMLIPWNSMSDNKAEGSGNYEPLANVSDDSFSDSSDDYMEEQIATEADEASSENNFNGDIKYDQLEDSLENKGQSPRGTAFLITEDGLFLTSKHLVDGRKIVPLQQKELGITFETSVIYSDSLLDFSILKSSETTALNFEAVPFKIQEQSPELGDEVFTLGYPKRDIVYTKGSVSSETGYESDSIYYEVSMPSNAGHSGAPLFNEKGELVGIITAHLSDKQAVTYVLRPDYIQDRLTSLSDSLKIDLSRNYSKRISSKKRLIKLYRPFIFEVH